MTRNYYSRTNEAQNEQELNKQWRNSSKKGIGFESYPFHFKHILEQYQYCKLSEAIYLFQMKLGHLGH